jgi:hypothetical protein
MFQGHDRFPFAFSTEFLNDQSALVGSFKSVIEPVGTSTMKRRGFYRALKKLESLRSSWSIEREESKPTARAKPVDILGFSPPQATPLQSVVRRLGL